jgi:hypothetical protein
VLDPSREREQQLFQAALASPRVVPSPPGAPHLIVTGGGASEGEEGQPGGLGFRPRTGKACIKIVLATRG